MGTSFTEEVNLSWVLKALGMLLSKQRNQHKHKAWEAVSCLFLAGPCLVAQTGHDVCVVAEEHEDSQGLGIVCWGAVNAFCFLLSSSWDECWPGNPDWTKPVSLSLLGLCVGGDTHVLSFFCFLVFGGYCFYFFLWSKIDLQGGLACCDS